MEKAPQKLIIGPIETNQEKKVKCEIFKKLQVVTPQVLAMSPWGATPLTLGGCQPLQSRPALGEPGLQTWVAL